MQLESVFAREAREAAEREEAMRQAEVEADVHRLGTRIANLERRLDGLKQQLAALDAFSDEAEKRGDDPLARMALEAIEGQGFDPIGTIARIAATWNVAVPPRVVPRPTVQAWIGELERERRELRKRLKQTEVALEN
jgi:chromosome segregation ATPase